MAADGGSFINLIKINQASFQLVTSITNNCFFHSNPILRYKLKDHRLIDDGLAFDIKQPGNFIPS